jgi:hypothetical protein
LLTQFVTEHDQYAWQIDSGVVSVFPKEGCRDPLLRELLATELNSFSVKEKTDCVAFAKSLLDTPEVRKTLGGYGLISDTGHFGGFYIQQLGQSSKLDVLEMQLKATPDRVVKESPAARPWVGRRDHATQRVSLCTSRQNLKTLRSPPKNLIR